MNLLTNLEWYVTRSPWKPMFWFTSLLKYYTNFYMSVILYASISINAKLWLEPITADNEDCLYYNFQDSLYLPTLWWEYEKGYAVKMNWFVYLFSTIHDVFRKWEPSNGWTADNRVMAWKTSKENFTNSTSKKQEFNCYFRIKKIVILAKSSLFSTKLFIYNSRVI